MSSLIAASALLFAATAAGAAPEPPAAPQLQAMAERTLASAKAPGFAVAVQWQGQLYYSAGFGVADTLTHAPVTAQTRFAIGSVSKQFAAVSVLQLLEQGLLTLEEPIAKYLPQLPNASEITVRMLLNQTSGLHNYPLTSEHDWPLAGEISSAKLVAILATDKPNFAPGTHYEYSNSNYLALAAIVEKVSGLTYSAYLKRNIFDPLGMASTGNGFAAQHALAVPEGGQGDPRHPISLDLFTGAGSIVSNAPDMARWDEALMTGKLLKTASMKLLWTPGKPADGSSSDYAMGFVTAQLRGHRELWHNGLTPTAGGYNLNAVFPDDHLAIVVLSNGPGFAPQPEELVKAIATAFFPQVTPVQPAAAQPASPPVEDPAVTALARKIYSQMRAGKVDAGLMTAQMNEGLSPDKLAGIKPMLDQLGDPTKLTLVSRQTIPQGTKYEYLAEFPTAQLHVRILIDTAGKVAGYFLAP